MNSVKKLLTAIPIVLSLCSVSAFAKNNVSEIDIEVTVRNDGSAYIVQSWSGNFSEGTENYIPIATDDISVSDLKVSDEKGEYSLVGDWDINAGFEEKARKCGINETENGVELCFGISEYGEKSYAIEYAVTDFIKGYTDYDGTNFMFINPNMSTFPTDGHISIVLENGVALNEENCAMWAFGYDGNVEFQSGAVTVQTDSALNGSDSMVVMLQLNKGLISPALNSGDSFEVVKSTALEGSDYGYEDDADGIIKTIIRLVLALIVLFIVLLIKRKKEIKDFYKKTEYFRDIPNSGKIEVSHYLAQSFDVAGEESLIIGALILSMINKGMLEPQLEESVGFFGKVKKSVNLKLMNEPTAPSEQSLYTLLAASAGEDGILQEKELENYAYKHPEKINDFVDSVKEKGKNEFISLGGFTKGVGNRIKDLSDNGRSELAEIMGLKKYLEEFTLIDEREITEAAIWKEYMVYATLFGIADKVIKQLERLYPERMPEIEGYNRNVIIATGYYRSMYRSSQSAIQARRTSGAGGRASFGGGGGFSGGGSGGGSR